MSIESGIKLQAFATEPAPSDGRTRLRTSDRPNRVSDPGRIAVAIGSRSGPLRYMAFLWGSQAL